MTTVNFGPGGNADSFYAEGRKSSLDAPVWLQAKGLNAYEYQCGRGVRIGEKTARQLGENARDAGVSLSLHAPYYINIASEDPEQVAKSKTHILKSMRAAAWLGASPVVFHSGSARGDRQKALLRAQVVLEEVLNDAAQEGLGNITLAPETLGRFGYLGLLPEVVALCQVAPQIVPCVDFGHIHALSKGSLVDTKAYAEVLDTVGEALGENAVKNLHIHFSPVEYDDKGEKRHLTLSEDNNGPNFEPLATLIVERNLTPTIICESRGTQVEDALVYKNVYLHLSQQQG